MAEVPQHASVVVIGAGIVGNSVAYHLAQKGWKDIVLLDQGPLPNPGGSTGHASSFIFPIDHSKTMTHITQDSMEQFKKWDLFRESGGIELARTEERMEELRRRIMSAKAWGEEAELLTPDGVKERMPFVNTDLIVGGMWSPTVGVADPLRAGTVMREEAQALGALTVSPNTEVTELEVQNGRIRGVQTDRGHIRTDTVVVACGVWSPRIARMAGASIPLTPLVHQMISVGPIRAFEESEEEVEYPLLRDMSTYTYERQNGSDMEIGSYAHRPILHEPDEIPSVDEAKLSPTEFPFTGEDFEESMGFALELLPELLDDEDAGIRHAVNGLISMTPDGAPVLGETPEVEGLWSAAAVWIKEGPGVGRMVAEWMTDGAPESDPNELDIARFYEHARTVAHVKARGAEGFPKIYGIIHPQEQWLTSRDIRLSPFYGRERQLDAVFFEAAGWERPHWYESNRHLLEEYRDRIPNRPYEWDRRWWSPIINAEHLAMRDRVAMIDLSAFAVFDITGPGALDNLQRLAMAQMDVPIGKAVYTPLFNEHGGIKSDLTVMRRGENEFRVVTGGGGGSIDKKWFVHHLPQDGSAQLHDRTSALCTVGVWGPYARDLVQSVTEDDVSDEAFPFATAQEITIGEVQAWALRISYVGELGWEIYAPMEQGRRLWDILWQAGRSYGIVPVGIGVYGTTARLEKGYRLYGHELETEYNAVEAGIARPKVKRQDFIGKQAYLRARDEEPAARLCTLTVDDHKSGAGLNRFMLGHEPILTLNGEPIVDAKGRRSYVTSAGDGPSVGKYILMGYLPAPHAREGNRLLVEYFGEHYPVTVEVVGSRPLLDPDNERMKG